MENDVEAADDQGSDWFEVKKRHRTSSKLSIRYVSGESSGKTNSASRRYQASTNEEAGNPRGRRQPQRFKPGIDFAAHAKVSGGSFGLAPKEADKGTDCLDKLVVNQDIFEDGGVTNLICGTKAVVELPKEENLDKVPKIKWGHLEDEALTAHEYHGDSDGIPKINCADDISLKHGSVVNADEMVSHGSSHSPLQERKTLVTSEDMERFPDGILSLDVGEESLDENWKEVNEISFEDLGLCSPSKKVACSNDAVENLGKIHDECVEPSQCEGGGGLVLQTSIGNHLSLPAEEVRKMMPHGLKSEDGTSNISEMSIIHENISMRTALQDPVLPPRDVGVPEVSVDASATAGNEDQNGLQDGPTDMGDLGVSESGESKERFRQRLWCFLFENLNRAVDELYLLCELECDMEQIEEAILVLDEAASDFRELKSRVEGFEGTKRSSSQSSKDGMVLNVKTDHRRPHALSWEVRRITTSPHRAEILSSSIEAFKKIRQERAGKHVPHGLNVLGGSHHTHHDSDELHQNLPGRNDMQPNTREPSFKSRKQTGVLDVGQRNTNGVKRNVETSRLSKAFLVQNGRLPPQSISSSDTNSSLVTLKDNSGAVAGVYKRESLEPISETEKQLSKKDQMLAESRVEKQSKSVDMFRKRFLVDKEREKEKQNFTPWKSMDAWKERRNWEDILKSPIRSSSRVSHSPGMGRKSVERARVLHNKLMSPEQKKKTALDMKREAEEKHARAVRIRRQLENERVQRLQRTSEKLNRVNEWQAVRSLKLREGMYARHQRSESRHEAYLAQVARRAGDESSKVNEVRFITSLNEENKKLMLRQKLHDSEVRRAEKLQVTRTKQKEDTAREEAVLERRKLLEAEKLQRLAETQRRKEEAKVRREEERKASSAAREARAVEQLRRKEARAKAQQEEAELLAQKLAERLSESEQRRKFYLEQIREKASMDFRDQSSPLLRRSLNKESQGRSMSTNSVEDYQTINNFSVGGSALGPGNATLQQSLKRRIKKIRQRLMALKYDFTEPLVGAECIGIGYRTSAGAAKAKVGRWLQDLQRFRQARKEGAASIGLIVGDMIKYLEGKESELHASRQAGLLDFIASALPASHTSRPDACQVTLYLLRLLRVVLSLPANRSYFLSQNLLPPIIPMLSASLENYIKIAASSNLPGTTNLLVNKTSAENLELIAEVLEGFLWTVTTIIGHVNSDERQLQMQNGLMELVVSYQVIHHLRDLFALYDRPQIEGSPFPSSILLSLNLLAVFTSRSGTISSINWGSCLSKTMSATNTQEATFEKGSESLDLGDPSVINYNSGGNKSPSISQPVAADVSSNHSGKMHREDKLLPNEVSLSNIPQDRPLDGNCRKEVSDVSLEICNVRAASPMSSTTNLGEPPIILLEEHAKPLIQLKDVKCTTDGGERIRTYETALSVHDKSSKEVILKQPTAFLIYAISETGLVSLPSLLTAVLLQANNRLSSEQNSYILPSNFEEVATGVLKVLNNVAVLDINLLQSMLARPDLKMEFFHLMSFLLTHCTSKWKAANDQVGLLLLESLLLLGYFALFHPGNQAVLRWGKSPTILHKVCDLPFVFFSDPELTPILAGTLVAACYGSEQNRGVVQQELSNDMLLSLLKSCRQELQCVHPESSPADIATTDDPCDGVQTILDPRKPQGDFLLRSNRRSTRILSSKGGVSSGNSRVARTKNHRDSRGTKTCEDWAIKHNLPASGTSSTFMLHSRFPSTFIDRAEEFFSAVIPSASVCSQLV